MKYLLFTSFVLHSSQSLLNESYSKFMMEPVEKRNTGIEGRAWIFLKNLKELDPKLLFLLFYTVFSLDFSLKLPNLRIDPQDLVTFLNPTYYQVKDEIQ